MATSVLSYKIKPHSANKTRRKVQFNARSNHLSSVHFKRPRSENQFVCQHVTSPASCPSSSGADSTGTLSVASTDSSDKIKLYGITSSKKTSTTLTSRQSSRGSAKTSPSAISLETKRAPSRTASVKTDMASQSPAISKLVFLDEDGNESELPKNSQVINAWSHNLIRSCSAQATGVSEQQNSVPQRSHSSCQSTRDRNTANNCVYLQTGGTPRPHTATSRRIKSASDKFRDDVRKQFDVFAIRGSQFPCLMEKQTGKVVEKIRHDSVRRRIKRLDAGEREEIRLAHMRDTDSLLMRLQRMRQKNQRLSQLEDEQTKRQKALRRFRWVVRTVMMILQYFRAMKDISDKMTVRTAVETQWHTLNTSREARKLAFNPATYARSRVYAKVPPWAQVILDKTPGNRTETDCKRLHALLRGLKSFDKFTEQIQLAMCRSFTYQTIESQRIILRKGHVGQNFYFIYSGSVFVNVEDINAKGEKFIKTEVVLSKGDSFGELALLKDIKRTATIACRESCELFVVDKEVFAQVCPRIFEKELEEKVGFVSTLPLFHPKYWPEEALKNICFESQIQEYKTNKVVVVDSSQDEEWLYICMEGRCSIIKCLALDDRAGQSPESGLPEEGDMLTAEFLDSMGTSREKRTIVKLSKKPDAGSKYNKAQMLDSMALEYVSTQRKKQRDMLEKGSEQALHEEQRKRAMQGVITLNTLMESKLQEANGKEYVYLDIGTLEAGEVFDLANILKPAPTIPGNCLILVSSGAKLLRIKRQSFFTSVTEEGLEHAIHLGMAQKYPSDHVLLYSYKEKSRWDTFKGTVVEEVMGPYMGHARRRYLVDYLRNQQKEKRKQGSKLISALKKIDEQNPEVEEKVLMLALDSPEIKVYEDFESRMLKDADAAKSVLKQPLVMKRKMNITVHGMQLQFDSPSRPTSPRPTSPRPLSTHSFFPSQPVT